ncbi:hypothetical protein KBG31_02820 [Patescibacteria group bacterium]|nr:hypothetical protein [Patescibacteria group bacterium]
MNNSYQAKNGFKTFLLTLVISLGVFGVVYYITSYPTYKVDIESHTGVSQKDVLSDSDQSPFAQLNTEMNAPRRVVLSGATEGGSGGDTGAPAKTPAPASVVNETTQSTVPDTGVASLTLSLLVSLVVLCAGLYYVYLGPRKLALQKFEDRILE